MLTFNVYDRVFFVKGECYGTAFTLDVGGRQYLISARHVVGNEPVPELQVFWSKKWTHLPTVLVGSGRGEIDISVLAPAFRLSEDIELEPRDRKSVV